MNLLKLIEDAIEILGMTNHYAYINSVIRIISKLPKEEQLNYKDFVIGAVDGRETSKAIYERLQAFADEYGYSDEFILAKNKEKIYDERRIRNAEDKQIRITTREEFEEAQSKSSNIFVDADDILDHKACECLYDMAETNNTDVLYHCLSCSDNSYTSHLDDCVLTGPVLDVIVPGCVIGFYKRKFILDHNIYFNPRSFLGEDIIFNILCNSNANKIQCTAQNFYFARVEIGLNSRFF